MYFCLCCHGAQPWDRTVFSRRQNPNPGLSVVRSRPALSIVNPRLNPTELMLALNKLARHLPRSSLTFSLRGC